MAFPAPRRSVRLLVLTAAVLVAALAPAAGAWAAGTARYVALGDSFASAPLVNNQISAACLRSDHNYPHVVASTIAAASFTDVTCNAAYITHMTTPQSTTFGTVPAQLDALSATTTLVTLTIGGNDSGLIDAAENCATLNPFVNTCLPMYDAGGADTIAAKIAALAPGIGTTLDAIHAKAPRAKVLITGYPTYFQPGGCYPSAPYSAADANYLESEVVRLDAAIKAQAAAHSATYVDLLTPSAGHDLCKAEATRWVEGFALGSAAEPLHPNSQGSAAFGAIVAAKAG
jgi:lysophospholipase L1-like esterase